MENESNDQCHMCKYFKRLYFKGMKQFYRAKLGYCRVLGECVGVQHDICDKYSLRYKDKPSDDSVLYYLNELMTEEAALRQALADACDELEEK